MQNVKNRYDLSAIIVKWQIIENLAEVSPAECEPLLDVLRAFSPIVTGCFGKVLDPEYPTHIEQFERKFLAAMEHVK